MSDSPPGDQPLREVPPTQLDTRLQRVSTPRPLGDRRWTLPEVEELQRLIPRYQIIELIGQGGMGAVYRARQQSLERTVAIKVLPLGVGETDPTFAERFIREARAMASLSHPSIVTVHDFEHTPEGLFYFVMEHVDGMTVEDMIRIKTRLDPADALAIIAHVCDALQYAHFSKVLHRDITSANIMVSYEGRVKVMDFGLAKVLGAALDSTLQGKSDGFGTPGFTAPEIIENVLTPDETADVYSVGATLYHMLTGVPPLGFFKLPSECSSSFDQRYDELIIKAMQKDRNKRYPNARAFRSMIDSILTHPIAHVAANATEAPAAIPQSSLPPLAERTRKKIGSTLGKPSMAASAGNAEGHPQTLHRKVRMGEMPKQASSSKNLVIAWVIVAVIAIAALAFFIQSVLQ
jgi:serine/threonine protein kinase